MSQPIKIIYEQEEWKKYFKPLSRSMWKKRFDVLYK